VRAGTSWVSAGDLGDLSVPPTTSALLAARIDRLTVSERATLERASVMGQLFYREALERLADEDVSGDVASLIRKQFVRPERSDLPGVDALAFRHLMIRDAAYDATPKALRAELHARFADWLEETSPEQDELIGFHLDRAHRYLTDLGAEVDRRSSIAERAASHLRVAGTRAYERFDIPATASLLVHATDLMRPEDPELVPALLELATAETEAGNFKLADEIADRAVRISEGRREDGLAARARMVRLS